MVNPVDMTQWDQVAARIGPVTDEGCWPWAGHINDKGYGGTRVKGKAVRAHRHVYEMLIGPIPEDSVLDHECHNRAAAADTCEGGATCRHRRCVNPSHLRPVTHQENIAAGNLGYASRTLCRAGLHDITSPEAWIVGAHGRQCRECERLRESKRDARKRGRR